MFCPVCLSTRKQSLNEITIILVETENVSSPFSGHVFIVMLPQ